jgi:hypothetical protein
MLGIHTMPSRQRFKLADVDCVAHADLPFGVVGNGRYLTVSSAIPVFFG